MSPQSVRQSFNRAATSYEASARLQQQVADQLVQDIRASLPDRFSGRILDAGCGTGYCLSQLHRLCPDATLLAVDFAEAMLQQSARLTHALTLNADLQQLPLSDSSIDLYVSSLAWQWCNTQQALHETLRILKPGAGLWLTTLVDGTFHEMTSACRDAGLSPAAHLLAMSPEERVLAIFDAPTLALVSARGQPIITWHADFSALRHSIRGVGANRLPAVPREPIDRATRQRLIAAYEDQRTPRGLPLTYQVLTIHAQRI